VADLTDTITDAAATPAAATGDGQSVTARSLPDLIATDKYLRGNSAGALGLDGLVTQVIVPPSALG